MGHKPLRSTAKTALISSDVFSQVWPGMGPGRPPLSTLTRLAPACPHSGHVEVAEGLAVLRAVAVPGPFGARMEPRRWLRQVSSVAFFLQRPPRTTQLPFWKGRRPPWTPGHRGPMKSIVHPPPVPQETLIPGSPGSVV